MLVNKHYFAQQQGRQHRNMPEENNRLDEKSVEVHRRFVGSRNSSVATLHILWISPLFDQMYATGIQCEVHNNQSRGLALEK